MFEDFAALKPYAAAANLLASKSDWGPLYDTEVRAWGVRLAQCAWCAHEGADVPHVSFGCLLH